MSSSQPSKQKRIMIVAGEASGDLHAAKLVKSVLAKQPDCYFYGIGGSDMRAAGVETLVDSSQLAVVGIIEVLAHRKIIFGTLNRLRELLRTEPPDLLILTDYPDFNLRLAKTAKECGVKVLYYISPQVWAWRQGRVKTIRERVDMMAVVFPFEEDFYKKHNVPVCFVGHPLLGEVEPSKSRSELLNEFNLDDDKPVVGLFPGSRKSEIKRLLSIILKSAQQLKKTKPNLQYVLPVASTLNTSEFSEYINETGLDIKVIEQRPYDAIELSDVIITVSGTVTLEIALLKTPMVIINRLSWLSYALVSRLLKIDSIGLCNIIAGEKIVPELLQKDATIGNITAEINKILDDEDYANSMKKDLSRIRGLLESDIKTEISDVVINMLKES
jgi:lipid-A-disaccharide synthase